MIVARKRSVVKLRFAASWPGVGRKLSHAETIREMAAVVIESKGEINANFVLTNKATLRYERRCMPEQALFCSSRLLSQHARGCVPREPVLPPSVMVVAARERGLVATRLHYLRMSG